jgi:cell division transport system permease protein
MGVSLNNLSNVKAVEFVPKEDAWAEQLETMDDAAAKFFTQIDSEIPLPDAYKVTVKDLDLFDQTIKEIKQIDPDSVDTIRQNKDLAQRLVSIRRGISVIAIVIIAVLFAISLFIISNTIRLTVYSRRLEISIMKSVGATNSFVRLPFVVEGMILGIVSGCVGLGLVWGLYELAVTQFKSLLASLNLVALEFSDYALVMLGVFVAIGIVSGVGGSLITMRKYLNKEGSEISVA